MIEKLSEYKITSRDGSFINVECNTKIINTLIRKLNEVIDWVNDVSALRVIDKQVTANLPNIDAGELAFLSKENSDLEDELERTRKALDVAKDRLDTVRQYHRGTAVIRPDDIAAYCDRAIEQITALEQKDVK